MNYTPKIVDDDWDEITAMIDGREIRGWSYKDEADRRQKMQMAQEFVEGWHQAMRQPDLQQVLTDCEEYFDNRADAEYFPDSAGPIANDEMKLQLAIAPFTDKRG